MQRNPHLQPAQIGDICLLVEPHPQADIGALRARQNTLQRQHGGTTVAYVHLSCQRFAPINQQQLTVLIDLLQQGIQTTLPIRLDAVALQTLPVPVLKSTMLKWQIVIAPDLLRFQNMVTAALTGAGCTPLLAPGFVPNLVSALRDLPNDLAGELHDPTLPYHLFDAGKVLLSRIDGPHDFTLLATLF